MDLLTTIDDIYVSEFFAELDVVSEMTQVYTKHALILMESGDTDTSQKKPNLIKRFLDLIRRLARKFVKMLKRAFDRVVLKNLRKAYEAYCRKKYNVPKIDPATRKMKQTGTFHGEDIPIIIDFEKDVIYSFVMLKEGHTPPPKDGGPKAVHSIENYIDIMNRVLTRWLWMVEDKDKAFERIAKHYDRALGRVNVTGDDIPGIPNEAGKWGISPAPDTEPYHFQNGFYDTWGGSTRQKYDWQGREYSDKELMENRTPIPIGEFLDRCEKISKEYDAVVKRADEFCDKLEALIQTTSARDDVDYNMGMGSDYGYKGIIASDVQKRMTSAGKQVSEDEIIIIENLRDLSACFARYMSALVDGYMILKTEEQALYVALIKAGKAMVDANEKKKG